jgi:DNA polymerase epsilon subunit 2
LFLFVRHHFLTGPLDAGTSVALPRRPIPEQYTKSLRQRVRHITFASNPCRVRYFTQEIVLFREDLLKKMQRHLAVPLVLDDPSVPDITEQLVESLLDQVGTRRLLRNIHVLDVLLMTALKTSYRTCSEAAPLMLVFPNTCK